MSLRAIAIPSAEPPRSAARLDIIPRHAAAALTASPANALPIVPEHLLQPPPPRPGPLAVGGMVLAALVLHVGFAAMLVLLLQWRVLQDTAERPIPVEIVSRMPDQKKPPDKPGAAESPSSHGAVQPAGSPTANAQQSAPPPPPLVAPPPEARAAATQKAKPEAANAVPEPPKPEPSRTAPSSADPAVLASSQGGFAVPPPPTNKASEPKPPTPAPASRERQGTDIAAALPMDFSNLPTSFRAVLSGSGTQASEEYKGLVYGKLGRSPELAEKARALHLRGQAIVAFSIDDQGHVSNLRIAHSSGTPAVDTMAMEMVREAAPFPPPPPGTVRTFTPALSFGDN